jgi:hypothetical protein
MAKETTYAGMVGQWQRLLEPLKANRAELAHLEATWSRLQGMLDQALEINREQAARQAAKQEATRQIQELMPEGQRLWTLLRQSVKAHYGIRAEKLAEFGLQPFRGRRKPKPAPEEPQAPEPGNLPGPAPEAAGEPRP